jgi:lysophospholipase L1-like esterase
MTNIYSLLILCSFAALCSNPVYGSAADDPSLPNVLLIGDSISIGYTDPTRNQLAGKANVHRIPGNGMFSANGLANIHDWLGDTKWDVIHFNWGIWDTHLLASDGSIMSLEDEQSGKEGKIRTTVAEYTANLDKLVDIMLGSGAKLIWASSTPVLCRSSNRLGVIDKYNRAAYAVMRRKGVIINDLNQYIKPHLKEMQTDDGCHFLPAGDEYLGKKVAESVLQALASDRWQPYNFSATPVSSETIAGRTIVRYEHNCLKRWGYTEKMREYFYIVEPKSGANNPLMVCLHSAGGTGMSEMPSNVEKIAEAGDEFAGLVLNSGENAYWWWGVHMIESDQEKYRNRLTPTEARVLDTVEWAIRHNNIDRNRVYMRGISMGGSGTLGIGVSNGSVFASLLAGVPAGTKHTIFRMENPVKSDRIGTANQIPPVVVFFSQKDIWAKGMEDWLDYVKANKLCYITAWGPWGHENHYEMTDPAAYEFPWLEIKRNEALPAFTNSSSDNKYPGFESDGEDKDGQMNAYFRWKVIEDKPDSFSIELRLVRNDELKTPANIPERAVTDVTLRRFQRFAAGSGKTLKWTAAQNESVVASGASISENNMVSIDRLTISSTPINLTVTSQ